MMPGSAYRASPTTEFLSHTGNGEGYTFPHGIASFREKRPESAGHRAGDVAELRSTRSRPGPAGDRRDPKVWRYQVWRYLRRHIADVRRGRARPGPDAGRAPAGRGGRDQGLGRLGARGP